MKIPEKILDDIRAHAFTESPKECCGVVVVKRGKFKYIACRNISRNGHDTFILHPEDHANAEDQGEIVRIVHSHPYASPEPSEADLVGCSAGTVPWLIMNHPLGHYVEIEPNGYRAPLIGRTFVHGVIDCYTLAVDYYKQELDIELPHFERNENWWNTGENLYVDNFEKAGFIRVSDAPRKHDAFLMQIRSPVPNHAAVYLGDELILHHMHSRLSTRDNYGGYWQKATVIHLRHRSQENDNA